jgi:phospholipid/cholesterol/gamma-HCH transport system substrate-binding protein
VGVAGPGGPGRAGRAHFSHVRTTGGLFEHKHPAALLLSQCRGLKDGAPVTLEGVTIGNVIHVRVVPDRESHPCRSHHAGGRQIPASAACGFHCHDLRQAGVLGDSYVDISSINAIAAPHPPIMRNSERTGSPSIQSVITSSNGLHQEINVLMKKIETLVDTLNPSAARRASL